MPLVSLKRSPTAGALTKVFAAVLVEDRGRLFKVLIVAAYTIWYLCRARRPIRLTVPEGLRRIIVACPSLHKSYAPTIYAPTWYGQMLLLALRELLVWVRPSPFTRELLTLRDSQVMALDWLEPSPSRPPRAYELPVAVLLHGAFHLSGSRSSPMIALASSLSAVGCPVVVQNRRGYGVPMTQPRFAFYGDDEDIDEILLRSVAVRYPGRPIALIGFSAGSNIAFRYSGRLSAGGPLPPGLPRCSCCVVWDGDPDLDDELVLPRSIESWPVRVALGFLMYSRYYRMNNHVLGRTPSRAEIVKQLSPTSKVGLQNLLSVHRTHKLLRKLSNDFKSPEEYCSRQSFKQYLLSETLPPTLLLNSADDPVCVCGRIESNHREATVRNKRLALAEFERGAHGAKFGPLGFGSVVPGIIAEFVEAVTMEHIAASPACGIF